MVAAKGHLTVSGNIVIAGRLQSPAFTLEILHFILNHGRTILQVWVREDRLIK